MASKEYYQLHLEQCRIDARIRAAIKRRQPGYREKASVYTRQRRRELRRKCIMMLGGKCSTCSNANYDVLQIDHINGGGNIEASMLSSRQLYSKIINGASGYQVLCANCNWKKRNDKLIRTDLINKLRSQLFNKYGDHCIKCYESDLEVLHFDHVNNDGFIMRTRDMTRMYNEYLKGRHVIQVLCANCHQIKTNGVLLK